MLHIICKQCLDHMVAPAFFLFPPFVHIYPFKHERAHFVAGGLNFIAHAQVGLSLAFPHNVGNHGVDALAVGLPQHVQQVLRQFEFPQHPGADGVVDVMVNVGDAVRPGDAFPLQRFGLQRPGMLQYPVPHLPGQVQPFAAFQHLHHPQALFVMAEAVFRQAVEGSFAAVAKGGMAQVVSQSDGLGQILI